MCFSLRHRADQIAASLPGSWRTWIFWRPLSIEIQGGFPRSDACPGVSGSAGTTTSPPFAVSAEGSLVVPADSGFLRQPLLTESAVPFAPDHHPVAPRL